MSVLPALNVGDLWTAGEENIVANYGLWTAYTPALTGSVTNPTLGAGGVASGSYTTINKTLLVDIQILFGTSGTAAGSGVYSISLPVATVVGSSAHAGYGYIKCAGLFTRVDPIWATSTTINLYYIGAAVNGAQSGVTNAAPGAWTANDLMRLRLALQTT